MPAAIEITGSAIRLCRIDNGRLRLLESFPIPEDADPVAALAAAPLPPALGEVRVLLDHPDLLVRTIVQPPVPHDRLDRMVRFELQSLGQDDDALLAAWRLAPIDGDMRITALVGKRALVAALRAALEPHGARLVGCSLPGSGLFHAWQHQTGGTDTSSALVVDVGGGGVHTCLIENGELLYLRSAGPGVEELVAGTAELRGIGVDDARSMLAALGRKPPHDLRELMQRQATTIATTVGNQVRFAKAQLRIEQFEPHAIHLTGAGARLHGLAEALETRLKAPARMLNPFAGRAFDLDTAILDREARLPTPHAAAIGAAGAETLALDLIDELRAERRTFWLTAGALRIAAATCLTLLLLAVAMLEVSALRLGTADTRLSAEGDGLVPAAEAVAEEARTIASERDAMRAQLESLAHHRDAGRVAVEYLTLIAELQHPEDRPVYVRRFGVQPRGAGSVQVEMEGFGEDARRRNKSEVVNAFRAEMRERYRHADTRIVDVRDLPAGVEAQRLPFHWVIEIATAGDG